MAVAESKARADASADRSQQATPAKGISTHLGQWALVIVLAILIITFTCLRPSTFGTWNNFVSITDSEVPTIFLALAATLPFVVGEFDLSIAATAALSEVLLVGLVLQDGVAVPLAICITLAAAVVVGLVNGIAIARFRISSFIVTLATGSILGGAMLAYSKGQSIFGEAPPSLTSFARAHLLTMPLPVWYALAAAVGLGLMVSRSPVGRRMYATGSNERAARLTGIATTRYVIVTMVASALLSSVGGILLGASLGSATPDTSDSLLIPAFAAAFLGTAGFAVGRFNVPGTFVAVLIVGVAVSGLEQLGAALWVQPVFDGVVLFVAVGLTAFTTRLRAAAAHRARLREIADRIAEMEYNAEHSGNGTVVGTSGLADIQQ